MKKMYKKANLTAAFALQDRFMDSENKDSLLDLDYADINPDQSDSLSVLGSNFLSKLRLKSRSRSISRTSSETE